MIPSSKVSHGCRRCQKKTLFPSPLISDPQPHDCHHSRTFETGCRALAPTSSSCDYPWDPLRRPRFPQQRAVCIPSKSSSGWRHTWRDTAGLDSRGIDTPNDHPHSHSKWSPSFMSHDHLATPSEQTVSYQHIPEVQGTSQTCSPTTAPAHSKID